MPYNLQIFTFGLEAENGPARRSPGRSSWRPHGLQSLDLGAGVLAVGADAGVAENRSWMPAPDGRPAAALSAAKIQLENEYEISRRQEVCAGNLPLRFVDCITTLAAERSNPMDVGE
jgi:hypothetical protein